MDQKSTETSALYLNFAEAEAHGRSAIYEKLARCIAYDQQTIRFLLTLPREKRQPNLLLGAVRHLSGTLEDWPQFRDFLANHCEAIRAVMLARSTQTNEPARCATLLPLLMRLPQPLALIEVGASAGLCLLLEHYAYDYGASILRPTVPDPRSPMFSCAVNELTPLPRSMPEITWRVGLDLNPLDATDPEQAGWLEALVWPEHTDRLANLGAAIGVAAAFKPQVVEGDLRVDLARLAREAPRQGTLVIFHSAVLAYVSSAAERQRFAREVRSLCDYWISNESPRVFPDISRLATRPRSSQGMFLLSANGIPVGWTDPHGAALEWISDSRSFLKT